MERVGYSALLATCTAALILLVSEPASAIDSFNFSGKYVAEHQKGAFEDISTLEVIHNSDNIEFTRVELGIRTVGHCPLDGSEGDYTSSLGVSGKCKANLKPKYLILKSVFLTHPRHAPPLRVHRKEKWRLSADAKTLTIEYDETFPELPLDISSRMLISGTVKYERTSP
jgi:hypothetical protein